MRKTKTIFFSFFWFPNKASLSFGRTSAGIVWCFWGIVHTIETTTTTPTTTTTTTMEYLIIAELTLNYINQKNIWNQFFIKSFIPQQKNISTKSHIRQQKTFALDLWTQRDRVGCGIGKILQYPYVKNMFKSRIKEVHQQNQKINNFRILIVDALKLTIG